MHKILGVMVNANLKRLWFMKQLRRAGVSVLWFDLYFCLYAYVIVVSYHAFDVIVLYIITKQTNKQINNVLISIS